MNRKIGMVIGKLLVFAIHPSVVVATENRNETQGEISE